MLDQKRSFEDLCKRKGVEVIKYKSFRDTPFAKKIAKRKKYKRYYKMKFDALLWWLELKDRFGLIYIK